MIFYYSITALVVALSFIAVLFSFDVKKTNYYILMLTLLMTLSSGGYLFLALSGTVEEAILANKIIYLGGCFVQPITLMLTCTICNYKMPAWLRGLMYSYSFIVYAMVLTIGYNDLYYTETHLEQYMGVSVLGHSYGIGHNFFYVLIFGHMLIQIILLIYTIVTKKPVSQKNLWALVGIIVVNTVLFIMGRAVKLDIEIMPLSYAIAGWIFYYLYHRGLAYNIEDNVARSLEEQNVYGYVVVDNSMNFLGCNHVAGEIFPSLSHSVIDRKISQISDTERILEWINGYIQGNSNSFSYETGGRHFECRIERLKYRTKSNGYILELREDTDNWKYTTLLAENNERLKNFQAILKQKVGEQTQELQMQQMHMQELFMQTVTALSEAVDAKDRYTSGHSRRVAEYSRMIAARMGKSEDEQEEIYRAGLLHDIGKIRIQGGIINKPGKLTDEEYNIIKIHSITGYHILRTIADAGYIAIAAKYHHERYDGKGYPNGLAGTNIPEVARILGVADSYDAMASNRSYRNALPQEVIRSEIERCRGTQFDPEIADVMLQIIDEDTEYTLRQSEAVQRKILTVDDEPINNKLIARIMRDEPDYEVVAAGSGREALELLGREPFDLILLDMYMPDMSGLETLKQIREKYSTPVVLMTSDRSMDISSEFAAYGCDDYITKPFLPLLVKEIIYNMTDK